MGGQKSTTLSSLFGVGFYFGSAQWPLRVERVPFRLMFACLGYTIGINVASSLYGEKNNYLYYTKKERQILVDQFGEKMTRRIKVIEDEEESGKQSDKDQ